MNEKEFWGIVDASRPGEGRELQVAKLKEAVLRLSQIEYCEFLKRFIEAKHAITSRDDLINAAYLANEQCLSQDVLDYFCYWLIGSGSVAYQQALKNPDVVVDLMRQHGHPSFEEFAGALSIRQEKCEFASVEDRPAIKGRIWSAERQLERLPRMYEYSR